MIYTSIRTIRQILKKIAGKIASYLELAKLSRRLGRKYILRILELEARIADLERMQRSFDLEIPIKRESGGVIYWDVKSSDGTKIYTVRPKAYEATDRCDCADAIYRGVECKHQKLVRAFIRKQNAEFELSLIAKREEDKKKFIEENKKQREEERKAWDKYMAYIEPQLLIRIERNGLKVLLTEKFESLSVMTDKGTVERREEGWFLYFKNGRTKKVAAMDLAVEYLVNPFSQFLNSQVVGTPIEIFYKNSRVQILKFAQNVKSTQNHFLIYDAVKKIVIDQVVGSYFDCWETAKSKKEYYEAFI